MATLLDFVLVAVVVVAVAVAVVVAVVGPHHTNTMAMARVRTKRMAIGADKGMAAGWLRQAVVVARW